MHAVVAAHPGRPDVLRLTELPDPEPGPEQVRITVEYAAITFLDTQLRSGSSPGPGIRFPAVLGNGVGGTVDRVGGGVDPGWIGARVVTSTGGTGGYATSALAQVSDLHRVPAELALADATAVLADGRTAVGLLRAADVRSGDAVVVTAAAGGVGSLLVQLAVRAGARVIGLAGSDAKLQHARDLGVHDTLNYRAEGWAARLRLVAPDGVDVVFDGIGATVTEAMLPMVRPGGRYLPHGAAGGAWGVIDEDAAAARSVKIVPLAAIARSPAELFALVEEALRLTAARIVRPVVGQTFRLAAAADAHTAIEARTTIGKTLLIP